MKCAKSLSKCSGDFRRRGRCRRNKKRCPGFEFDDGRGAKTIASTNLRTPKAAVEHRQIFERFARVPHPNAGTADKNDRMLRRRVLLIRTLKRCDLSFKLSRGQYRGPKGELQRGRRPGEAQELKSSASLIQIIPNLILVALLRADRLSPSALRPPALAMSRELDQPAHEAHSRRSRGFAIEKVEPRSSPSSPLPEEVANSRLEDMC